MQKATSEIFENGMNKYDSKYGSNVSLEPRSGSLAPTCEQMYEHDNKKCDNQVTIQHDRICGFISYDFHDLELRGQIS